MTWRYPGRIGSAQFCGFILACVVAAAVPACKDAGTEPPPPPPAATVPLATAPVSVAQTSFTATWQAFAGVNGYRLDVGTDSLFAAYVPAYHDIDVANATSWPVTGLTPGTRYHYRLRAVMPGGSVTASSNVISVTTLKAAPVSFAARVKPIFQRYGCNGCHGGSGGFFVGSVQQLLSTGNHAPNVIAGNSAQSNLIKKLLASPPFGSRMPQGGPFLPEDTVNVIRAWIDEGANDN